MRWVIAGAIGFVLLFYGVPGLTLLIWRQTGTLPPSWVAGMIALAIIWVVIMATLMTTPRRRT